MHALWSSSFEEGTAAGRTRTAVLDDVRVAVSQTGGDGGKARRRPRARPGAVDPLSLSVNNDDDDPSLPGRPTTTLSHDARALAYDPTLSPGRPDRTALLPSRQRPRQPTAARPSGSQQQQPDASAPFLLSSPARLAPSPPPALALAEPRSGSPSSSSPSSQARQIFFGLELAPASAARTR
jgi:hypothetical protein